MVERTHPEVDAFLAALDQVYPGDARVALYGSWARGDQFEASDLNLLVVVPALDPARLARLGPALRRFAEATGGPPLLVAAPEWLRAADGFPVEITDIRLAHRVLRGPDPVAGLEVSPADLRRALERELRGKLLRLRLEYALAGGDAARLGQVAGTTVGSFRVLLRTALVLFGVEPPGDDPGLVRAAARRFALAPDPLADLLARRRKPERSCEPDRFEDYLAAVAAVTDVVDNFEEELR